MTLSGLIELNDDGFTIIVDTADCSVVRHEDVLSVVQQTEGLSFPIRAYDCHVLEIHDSPPHWLPDYGDFAVKVLQVCGVPASWISLTKNARGCTMNRCPKNKRVNKTSVTKKRRSKATSSDRSAIGRNSREVSLAMAVLLLCSW